MGVFKEITIERESLDPNLSFQGLEREVSPSNHLSSDEKETPPEKDIFTLDIFGDSIDGDAQFFKFW